MLSGKMYTSLSSAATISLSLILPIGTRLHYSCIDPASQLTNVSQRSVRDGGAVSERCCATCGAANAGCRMERSRASHHNRSVCTTVVTSDVSCGYFEEAVELSLMHFAQGRRLSRLSGSITNARQEAMYNFTILLVFIFGP